MRVIKKIYINLLRKLKEWGKAAAYAVNHRNNN